MEKKRTNSGPLMESTSKHSIYPSKEDGTFDNYDVNSASGRAGLDLVWAYLRVMADVNDDGRADYCRFVGNAGAGFLSCATTQVLGEPD